MNITPGEQLTQHSDVSALCRCSCSVGPSATVAPSITRLYWHDGEGGANIFNRGSHEHSRTISYTRRGGARGNYRIAGIWREYKWSRFSLIISMYREQFISKNLISHCKLQKGCYSTKISLTVFRRNNLYLLSSKILGTTLSLVLCIR